MAKLKINFLFKIVFSFTFSFFSFSAFADKNSFKNKPPQIFEQRCHTDEDDNTFLQLFAWSAEEIEWKFVAFEDSQCQTPYLLFKRSYKVESEQKNNLRFKAAQPPSVTLKTIMLEASYVSLTDEVTQSLNLIRFCGLSHWKTGQSQIVTGRECGDYRHPVINTPKEFYLLERQNRLFIDNDEFPYFRL